MDIQNLLAFHGVLRLQNWTESSKEGRKVYFLIPGEGQNPFRHFTVRDGKIAGQRFTVALNLMDDAGTEAWNGELMLLRWNISGKTGRTAVFLLADHHSDEHPFAKYKTGVDGQAFAAAFVELSPTDEPVPQPESVTRRDDEGETFGAEDKPAEKRVKAAALKKPYGEYARELHRFGWFLQLDVLKAIGCEDDFHAWISRQPCIFSSLKEHDHGGRVRFMKVNGAQAYAAIPICSTCQPWDIIPESTRNKYVKQWAEGKVSRALGVESLGFAPPEAVVEFALGRGISNTLPMIYRQGGFGKLPRIR